MAMGIILALPGCNADTTASRAGVGGGHAGGAGAGGGGGGAEPLPIHQGTCRRLEDIVVPEVVDDWKAACAAIGDDEPHDCLNGPAEGCVDSGETWGRETVWCCPGCRPMAWDETGGVDGECGPDYPYEELAQACSGSVLSLCTSGPRDACNEADNNPLHHCGNLGISEGLTPYCCGP